MKQKWIEYFDENGYRFSESDNVLNIDKKNPGQPITIYLAILLFIPFVIFIAAFKIFLLLILLFFIPFVYSQWSLPFKLIVDRNKNFMTVGGNSYHFDSIKSIRVNEDVRFGDTSPFKEGCEDFVYEFHLHFNNGNVKEIFELWFRESMEDEMNDLAAYLTLHLGKEDSRK